MLAYQVLEEIIVMSVSPTFVLEELLAQSRGEFRRSGGSRQEQLAKCEVR
jgi:hypothetical protein